MRATSSRALPRSGILGGVPVSRLEPEPAGLVRPHPRRRHRDQHRRGSQALSAAEEEGGGDLIGESQSLSAGWIAVSGAGPRRQSLPGTGGDRAKRGGWGPRWPSAASIVSSTPRRLSSTSSFQKRKTRNPRREELHLGRVAHRAFGKSMRRPVHLHHEVMLEVDEIDDIGNNRLSL